MDEEVARIVDNINSKSVNKKKMKHKDLDIEITIESSFEPCDICKREILIRAQMYNAKIEIYRPMFINNNGVKQIVRRDSEFEMYYKQINEQVKNGKK